MLNPTYQTNVKPWVRDACWKPSLLDANSNSFEAKQGPTCHLYHSKILSPTRPLFNSIPGHAENIMKCSQKTVETIFGEGKFHASDSKSENLMLHTATAHVRNETIIRQISLWKLRLGPKARYRWISCIGGEELLTSAASASLSTNRCSRPQFNASRTLSCQLSDGTFPTTSSMCQKQNGPTLAKSLLLWFCSEKHEMEIEESSRSLKKRCPT